MYKDNPQTAYKQELKEKILTSSMHEFLIHGVKSVRMDDIANSLGISKRTLYEIYSNKEELLLEGVRLKEEEYDRHMTAYSLDSSHTVIDIIIEFYKRQVGYLSSASPMFFTDLHKYAQVMAYLDRLHAVRRSYALDFFTRGVREGYFRADVDYNIMLRLGSAAMETVMKEQMYNEYDLKHIFHNVILLNIRGLCTTEGIKLLDHFLDNEPRKQ